MKDDAASDETIERDRLHATNAPAEARTAHAFQRVIGAVGDATAELAIHIGGATLVALEWPRQV